MKSVFLARFFKGLSILAILIAVYFIGYEVYLELTHEKSDCEKSVINPITGEYTILHYDLKSEEEIIKKIVDYSLWNTDYLRSYPEFGPLKIGETALHGTNANMPARFKHLIPESEFYVYVLRRGMSFCEFEDCAIIEGRVVKCMGGWLQGEGPSEIANLFGLNLLEAAQGKASIVIVSDRNSKMIGIYPNHAESDILPILAKYPEYKESLQSCKNEIIGKLY